MSVRSIAAAPSCKRLATVQKKAGSVITSVVAALLAALPAVAQSGPASSAVARGRYLVNVLGACGNCHTPKGLGAADKLLTGGLEIREDFGVAIAPNITPDRDTGIGAWSDAEVVRAIREGKSRDGRTLGPPMPFYLYRRLSDNDAYAIVAYLRTVKPIVNKVERSRYTIRLPAEYGPPVGSVPEPPRDPVKYGEYLAGPVAHCSDCHTPRNRDGVPDPHRLLAGGFLFTGPWGTSYSANITPDRETGIGRWTDGQIVAAIYGVRPDGRRLLPPMPSDYYAAGIAEPDLKALLAYLRSVQPVRNRVPPARRPQ